MARASTRAPSAVTLIRLIANAFEAEGWRHDSDAPLELTQVFLRERRPLRRSDLAGVPSAFYVTNDTTPSRVLQVVNGVLAHAGSR